MSKESELRAKREQAHERAVHARKKVRIWTKVAHRAHGRVVALTKKIKALPKGRQIALKWALAQAGTTESPYGSNRGPKVSEWQRVFGMDGQPWCGAFVGNALKQAGVAVTNRIVYCPYIVQDGSAGTNGMEKLVPVAQAKAGDLIVFDWDRNGVYDHVGMLRKDYDGSGVLYTVEGNTSADNNGSQSNGGGVFLRSRATSVATIAIVRPQYAVLRPA